MNRIEDKDLGELKSSPFFAGFFDIDYEQSSCDMVSTSISHDMISTSMSCDMVSTSGEDIWRNYRKSFLKEKGIVEQLPFDSLVPFNTQQLDMFDKYEESVTEYWDFTNLYENLILIRSGRLPSIYTDENGEKNEEIVNIYFPQNFCVDVTKGSVGDCKIFSLYANANDVVPIYYKTFNLPYGQINGMFRLETIELKLRRKRFQRNKLEMKWNSMDGISRRVNNIYLEMFDKIQKDIERYIDKGVFYPSEIKEVFGDRENCPGMDVGFGLSARNLSREDKIRMFEELGCLRLGIDEIISLIKECVDGCLDKIGRIHKEILEMAFECEGLKVE